MPHRPTHYFNRGHSINCLARARYNLGKTTARAATLAGTTPRLAGRGSHHRHFKSADKYLLSVPMWNFSIPYKLKHYIDLLVQPGLTFSFTPAEGYKGLITGKPLVAVYARGGAYGPGSGREGYDQQSAYLKQIFGFIGVTEIWEIFVEPTLASPTSKEESVAAANRKATEMAARF